MSLTIKFKSCCEECTNRKTYLKEDARCYRVDTKIGCEHEEVCREYIESIEKKSIDEYSRKLPVVEPIITKQALLAEGVRSAFNGMLHDYHFITLQRYYEVFKKYDNRGIPVPNDITDEELQIYGWNCGQAVINRRMSIDCLDPDIYEISMSTPIKYIG